MTLELPIPHKPIEDAIQIEGVTREQILKVKGEQAARLRAEEYHLESEFKNHFTAATLEISAAQLGALRSAVRSYLQAEKALEYDSQDIANLITVGALEPNLWNKVRGSRHNRQASDLTDLVLNGGPFSELRAQDTYELIRVLRYFDFHKSSPGHFIDFCRTVVDPSIKTSAPSLLSYLGDKAPKAAHLFECKRPLSEIRGTLGLTTDNYAAWAVIIGLRYGFATGKLNAAPAHGDQKFIDAFNRRYTVFGDAQARDMFTDEALQEFNSNPYRIAYADIARGQVAGLELKLV